MDRGIIYLLAGDSYAELFCTSLWSLRTHGAYNGPVTVFAIDGQAGSIAHEIAEDKRLSLDVRVIDPVRVKRHQSYVTKPQLTRETPYKRTVFLDADTIVQGPLDELFLPQLAITQFCAWVSTGKIVGGRIRQWLGISPMLDALVERAVAFHYPAINTGVFGFHKDFGGLPAWRSVTRQGAKRSFTDELAMQLLFPDWPDCQVLDDRFNKSVKFGSNLDQARVLHFHGRKHVRWDPGWEMWRPWFEAARVADAGGMLRWGGRRDPGVRARLRQERRLARTDRKTSEAA